MIDYYSHLSILYAVQKTKAGKAFLTVSNQAPDERLTTSFAALGTLLDHLVTHSDGATAGELGLLRTAALLSRDVRSLLDEVALKRKTFEALVLSPESPDAPEELQHFESWLGSIEPRIQKVLARLRAVNSRLVQLKHIPEHGAADDRRVGDWPLRDVFTSRKTTAFLQSLQKAAARQGAPELDAFVAGAALGHAANIEASAYLNRVVGGPRRSHRYRHRVASYSAGAWLREHQPQLTPSLNAIRSLITFGAPGAPALPSLIEAALIEAWEDTYGEAGLKAPKFGRGYARLIGHLKLLEQFKPVTLPQPTDGQLVERFNAEAATLKSASTLPEGQIQVGSWAPPAGATPGEIAGWIFCAVAIIVVTIGALILGASSESKSPSEGGGFKEPGTYRLELTEYLKSPEALVQAQNLYQLHAVLYELAANALKVARLYGLIYPSADDLLEPWFSQFAAAPSGSDQPHRPMPRVDQFLFFPNSPLERPEVQGSRFAAGADPAVLVSDAARVLALARLLKEGADTSNMNLDADREALHACWKPRRSVTDDPIEVETLGFDAVD